jgi:hypothetical protein
MDEKWQGLRIIKPILGKAQKDEKVKAQSHPKGDV